MPSPGRRGHGTTERLEGQHRALRIAGLIAGIVIAALGGLALLGGILEAASAPAARVRDGETFGSSIGVAVFGLVILTAGIFLAIRCEHSLRRHHTDARAWTNPDPALVAARSAGRVFPRNRRFSPGLIIFELLLFGGMCAVLVGAAFVTHSEGDRSSLVQHHGIFRTGTVTAVHNTEHSSRGGSYYTSDIDVSLVSPVGGVATTTVRYPGKSSYLAGQSISVLIDSREPTYAELPGSPDTSSHTWIWCTVGAVVSGLLVLLFAHAYLQIYRHRRAANAPR